MVGRRIGRARRRIAGAARRLVTGSGRVRAGLAGGADNLGADSREHVFALSGDRAFEVYDRMWRSDPWVHAALLATTLPIRQGKFYVEPPSDRQQDKDRAELVGRNLLEEQTLVWADVLRQALLLVRYGFSILEKDYEYRDGLQLVRKLDPRHPTTVSRWDFGDQAGLAGGPRRLRGVWQFDEAGAEVFLPIEDLVVFTHEREGDNWSGRSMMRPMYKPWLLKEDLERTNAIAHARWGAGIPMATAPPGVTRESREWSAARRILQEIKAGLRAFVQLPQGWSFELIGRGGEGTDTLRSIQYYDEAIATAALALHLKLGGGRSGSRALGQVFESAFYHATQALADYVAEIFDRFVVAELYMMNWGMTAARGHFRVGRIHRTDLQAVGYLLQSGALTRTNDLEGSIREAMRFPPLTAEDEEAIEDGEGDGDGDGAGAGGNTRRPRLPATRTGDQ